MKLRIVMPLLLSAAALTGCQQLNDGVNTVNGAISSKGMNEPEESMINLVKTSNGWKAI